MKTLETIFGLLLFFVLCLAITTIGISTKNYLLVATGVILFILFMEKMLK